MKSADIREAFLKFFENKGHAVVASSSLVPGNDPTLLFTNAGMVQFKDVFLGGEKRNYSRAASSQRCVRAGGKHNDLENVGYTARHHTFFEMLGNFSFGDYFKREAIQYAWAFLTQELKLPPERLWVTVHVGDDEAADIWLNEVGVSAERFSRLDEDNFWQMGDTGPCGPCSEIFYDHGEGVPGGPPGSENDDLDRYIEVWNLVFMQYERQADGELKPLPKPSVDTGMGLERIAAVMQSVHSNYEIDLFQNLLNAVMRVTDTRDSTGGSLRVIADHIRSCVFLISDGVLPSNEGRGYVLRRIIRRAIRHGHKLGQTQPFFYKLVDALVKEMGEAYPEIIQRQSHIEKALLAEEEQFAKTLDKGLAILTERLGALEGSEIPGDVVFTLYDTYGFPVDLTNDIARERNLTLDMDGYEARMDEQRKKAKASGAFKVDYTGLPTVEGETLFQGYESLDSESQVLNIFVEGNAVDSITANQEAAIILNQTPFYAESGGQVGDTGTVEFAGSRFEVQDCQKLGRHTLHIGVLQEGLLSIGDKGRARVDPSIRTSTAANHSATHLLHAALRSILGEHVTQKGSLVDSERLRFDFAHFEAVKPNQLEQIEDLVNTQIRLNSVVTTELCGMEQAQQKGAMALFGEKYGEEVRVLTMGNGFSVELCGGTHVVRTGDIGVLKITSETGIASGVRRIEAVTGERALSKIKQQELTLATLSSMLKCSDESLVEKIEHLQAHTKILEKDIAAVKSKLAAASMDEWVAQAKDVNGVKLFGKVVEGADPKSLRDIVDQLKNKLGSSAVLLAAISEGKVSLVAGVTKDATKLIKAGDMVKHIAAKVDGKGGGRPDMAQGGGTNVTAVPGAMDELLAWCESQLANR